MNSDTDTEQFDRQSEQNSMFSTMSQSTEHKSFIAYVDFELELTALCFSKHFLFQNMKNQISES